MPAYSRHSGLSRTIAHSAAFALFAFVLGVTTAEALTVADERPIRPGQSFALRVDAGEVVVAAGEAGSVRVAADLQPGQRLAWRETSSRLALAVLDPARLSTRTARMRVNVPADASLALRLGVASLRLENVGGDRIRVEGGGAIRIRTSARRVHVDSVDGPIDVDISGPSRVRLSSLSGAVALGVADAAGLNARVETVGGPITIRIAEGQTLDVVLTQASGTSTLPPGVILAPDGRLRIGVDGESAPGAATLERGLAPGRVLVDTFNGNIFLQLAPETATTL